MSKKFQKFPKTGKGQNPQSPKTQSGGTSKNMKKEKMIDSEVMGNIVYSLINGNFTQARMQIADGLEGGVNLLDELDGQDENQKRFVLKAICQYLAYTPTENAKENVKNW